MLFGNNLPNELQLETIECLSAAQIYDTLLRMSVMLISILHGQSMFEDEIRENASVKVLCVLHIYMIKRKAL